MNEEIISYFIDCCQAAGMTLICCYDGEIIFRDDYLLLSIALVEENYYFEADCIELSNNRMIVYCILPDSLEKFKTICELFEIWAK